MNEDDPQYANILRPGYDSPEYVKMMVALHEQEANRIVGEVLDGGYSEGYLTIKLDSLTIALEEQEKWQTVLDLYDFLGML